MNTKSRYNIFTYVANATATLLFATALSTAVSLKSSSFSDGETGAFAQKQIRYSNDLKADEEIWGKENTTFSVKNTEIKNSSSRSGHNYNLVMSLKSDNNLFRQKFNSLVFDFNENLLEDEEEAYFQTFRELRKDRFYKNFFINIEEESNKIQLSVLELLAQLEFEEVEDFEKTFVIESLHKSSLQYQETSLKVISSWNDGSILDYINNTKLENRFLQKRLDKIIYRFQSKL